MLALKRALVAGQADSIHDNVYTVFGHFGAIHNLEWHYFQNIRGNNRGKGPCLYSLRNDATQTRNVIGEFPDMAQELRGRLQNHLGIEIPPLEV